MGRVLAALVALVLAIPAAASQYQQQFSSTWYADFAAAAAALAAAQPSGCTAAPGLESESNGTSVNEKIHYTNFDRTCSGTVYTNLGGYVAYHYCASNTAGYAWDDATHACTVQEFACPPAGTRFGTGGAMFPNVHSVDSVHVAAPGGSGYCYVYGSGVCVDIPGGSQAGTYCPVWFYSGEGIATTVAVVPGSWSGSATTARGSTVSITTDSDRCIVFNSEVVCPSNAPAAGTCLTSAGGNGYCTRDAGTAPAAPPAPDDGTPGSAAVPDAIVSAGAGASTAVDAYGPGALLGSTNSQPATGTPAPGPSGGSGGDQTPCGTTENPCHTETAGPSMLPTLDEAPEFGESLDTFVTSVQASPLAQLALGLSASVPEGGAAPSASVTLQSFGGAQFVIEAPEPVVAKVEETLPVLARLAWILTAIFIFLAA